MTRRRYMEMRLGPLGMPYPGCDPYDDRDSDLQRSDPPREKHDFRYRYAYDPFTIWGNPGPNESCNGSEYVDRLEQWDYAKYGRISERFYKGARPFDDHNCRGDLFEQFLREWFEDPDLKLLRVVEYCNRSSGYPTWRLDYHSPKFAVATKKRKAKETP